MEPCRLCSQQTNVFYLQSINESITTKLSSTFKIHLKDDEALPKNICQDCIEKLEESTNFYNHISNVQRSLKGCHEDFINFESLIVKSEQIEEPILDIQHYFDVKDEENEIFLKHEIEENLQIFASSTSRSKNQEKVIKPQKHFRDGIRHSTRPKKSVTKFVSPQIYPPKIIHPLSMKVKEFPKIPKKYKRAVEPTFHFIYKKELRGKFSDELLQLSLPPEDKLPNGQISQSAVINFSNIQWSNYKFACDDPACSSLTFSNVVALSTHTYEIHKRKVKLECPHCEFKSTNYASHVTHIIKRHSSNSRFSCIVCSEIYWNLKELHVHQSKSHPESLKICIYCGEYFNVSQSLKLHLFRKHKREDHREVLTCDFCGYQNKNKGMIAAHLVIHNKYRDEICEICGATFRRHVDLMTHKSYRHAKELVECEECGKFFKNLVALKKHKVIMHTEQKLDHVCECGKKFRNRYQLKVHKMVHDPTAFRYKCPHCEKVFKYSSGYLYHVRATHTFEKPYACPACDRKFYDFPNAKKHIRGAHGSDLRPIKNK